jgi:uncharacterized protein (DUF1684 family)
VKLPFFSFSSLSLAVTVLTGLVLTEGCGKSGNSIDVEAHRREIQEWRERRLSRLTSDTGWLTLCGLFWLKEGENKCGSDSTNDIIFPLGKAPRVAGSIWLEKGVIRFKARPKVVVRHKDSLATSLILQSDEDGLMEPTILNLGTLSFYVIKRGNALGVRVRDSENPARRHFAGLDYFPIDPKWRFDARFEPYDPPKLTTIVNVLGIETQEKVPGALVFEYKGKRYRLDAISERGGEDKLFIIFKDGTNGEETYDLGRQLYTDLPDERNTVLLEFNKAYNFPCAFTEFTTCPIPPKQNHLPFRVEAGEKKYAATRM